MIYRINVIISYVHPPPCILSLEFLHVRFTTCRTGNNYNQNTVNKVLVD